MLAKALESGHAEMSSRQAGGAAWIGWRRRDTSFLSLSLSLSFSLCVYVVVGTLLYTLYLTTKFYES